MYRGLTTLETAVLMTIVMASAALIGSMFLHPVNLQPTQGPTIIVYEVGELFDANVLVPNVTNGLYQAKVVDTSKYIAFGNGTYALVVVAKVVSAGYVSGVKISDAETGQLIKVINEKKYFGVGRRVIIIYLDKLPENAKIEFLNAKQVCVKCKVGQ